MKVAIMTENPLDISNLITSARWSGDKSQAARKLEITVAQDDRDANIPLIEVANGSLVYGGDEEGKAVFIGKIYEIEKDRAKSELKITSYDALYILNKSKTTRKYKDALPEDIAAEIAGEMGVKVGEVAKTGVRVSFIANNRTGYQIIQGAYSEASKQNEKQYQCLMVGEELSVIEKGDLCGVKLDSGANMTDSVYRESIEGVINRILIADESGNVVDKIDDTESQEKYGVVIQEVYKQQKDKDATEAKDKLKKVEREGLITAKGDYRAISGYSLEISDANFDGQFWIKSDVHIFKDNFHEMRLTLEFENLMEKVEVQKDKV